MQHKDVKVGDNHILPNWVVANGAARLALLVLEEDVYKSCWQEDTNTLYILTNHSPATWQNSLAGADGRTIFTGTDIPPGSGLGQDGDLYYNTSTHVLYGPKASGVWPAGVNLVGPAGADAIPGLPQNIQNNAYSFVLTDNGKHVFHDEATARVYTIPANASVAFPIGAAITVINNTGAGAITIAITSDTLTLTGAGTTGSRTLAANGMCTLIKVTSTKWIINGTGLS